MRSNYESHAVWRIQVAVFGKVRDPFCVRARDPLYVCEGSVVCVRGICCVCARDPLCEDGVFSVCEEMCV